MALRFVDGFDSYLSADAGKKWTVVSSITGIDPLYSRPGSAGKGMRLSSVNAEHLRILLTAQATWIIGLAIRFNSSVTASKTLFTFRDSANAEQCSVRVNASNQLTMTRGGTVLGSPATLPLQPDIWYYIEAKVTIGNSGSFDIHVDGVSVISGSGDTQTHASETTASSISVATTDLGSSQDIDDLYICDGSGGVNDTFLGPIRIATIRPNAAGNSTQWATAGFGENWANVSDEAADGDSTFNMSSTAAQKDLFALEDLPSGSIKGVMVTMWARQDAGATRTIRPVWRISSTNYTGTSVTTSGTYAAKMQCYDTSPATSSAWTQSELNGAELGYELVS